MPRRYTLILASALVLVLLTFFYWPSTRSRPYSRPLTKVSDYGDDRSLDDIQELLEEGNTRPQQPQRLEPIYPPTSSETGDDYASSSATDFPSNFDSIAPLATSTVTPDPEDLLPSSTDHAYTTATDFSSSTIPSSSLSSLASTPSTTATTLSRVYLPGGDDINPDALQKTADDRAPAHLPQTYADPLLTRVLPEIPKGTERPQRIDHVQEIAPHQPGSYSTHPIDELIRKGQDQYRQLKSKQTMTLEAAANAYREKRKRHPPPGFEQWWQFARDKGSIIIEDFFDQIYDDIEPFWARDPGMLRETAKTWHMKITVRNGTARWHSAGEAEGGWLFDWHHMIQYIEQYLPDVDLAFNNLDESRILVPWETINEYMQEASKHRQMGSPANTTLVTEYQKLDPLPDEYPETRAHAWEDWHNQTMWDFARMTCPTESEARQSELDSDLSVPPFYPPPTSHPPHTYHGFVSNWTLARSVCDNPGIRNIHGNFVFPRWTSINTTLFPLLGGSKIAGMNNEIIVPAAKYWSTDIQYSGHPDDASSRWSEKHDKAIWRGGATGGKHDETNWRRFQRQRFVSVMNGTEVELTSQKLANISSSAADRDPSFNILESPPDLPHDFPLPTSDLYDLAALKSTSPAQSLGDWVTSTNDAAFTHFMCSPQTISQFSKGDFCPYLEPFYTWSEAVDMPTQFAHKYLPDVDGNSFSGRYRAFLKSGSLPIKATIYAEWHDSRLVPWVHFVPMDTSYADYYALLEYFAGYAGAEGMQVRAHDGAAEEIAEEGRAWSNKVLRHEDMLVYMHRLVLEYARVTNDERDRMGWAGDLMGEKQGVEKGEVQESGAQEEEPSDV